MTALTEGDRATAARVVARIAEGQAAETSGIRDRDALIRHWRAGGVTSREIETAFGLSRSSVSKISARG